MYRRSLCCGILIVVLASLGLGCGGSRKPVKVEGLVTLDGKPVEGATVLFVPLDKEGNDATGVTNKEGVFHLTTFNSRDGALPGNYKVTVHKLADLDAGDPENPQPIDPKDRFAVMRRRGEQVMRNKGRPPRSRDVPAVYGDLKQTPLRSQVPPPDGQVILELNRSGGT